MSMERMWDMASTISAIAGLFVSAIFVARFYVPYVIKKKSAVLTGIVFFAVMTVLYLIPFSMSGVVAYIIGIIAVCLTSLLCERRNVPQKVFLSMTIYMFLWISQVIAALPWKLISGLTFMRETSGETAKQFVWFIVALVLLIVVENALLFFEIFISETIYARKNERMEWRELTLLASPYVAVIAGYWISSFLSDVYLNTSGEYVWNNYPVYDGIRALFGVIAFLAAITVMYSYQRMKQSQEDALQNALVSKQVEELSGHVHAIEALYSDIRGIRHDINNHIMVLGNLLDKGEADEAAKYLNEWQNGFPMPEINAKTGNPVTDIVISEKMREAEEAGISFSQDFHYPSSGNVESIDIGIILNNALSNAIRAASESKDPHVEVKAWKNNNAYLIQVKNSFSGKLSLDPQTGLLETSKKDKESHGYGLMNMKRITEKYYGTIQLEQREDMVIFTALMMIPG
ncbi:GHKL domain-containing protein [Lachnospiraceae bacterium C10]|nr:GHKL domain-containing protein [Lachnospiraceae bacterium C10]